MFKLSKKRAILRATLVGVFVVAVLSAVAYHFINQNEESKAATQDGANVTVVYYNGDEEWYYYGSGTGSGDHHTRHYGVKSGSKTYEAYCAQPRGSNPTKHDATRPAVILPDTLQYQKIKLMMYIRQYLNPDYNNIKETILENVDGNRKWGDSVFRRIYAFTHAVIGGIYANDYTGLDGSYASLKTQVDDTEAYLETLINENNPVWVAAQNYQLYVAKDSGSQDVVWIEPNYSISTSASDAADGDKFVEASPTSIIKDTVSFCAAPNYTYTLKGVLMDKETGEPLTINGQAVEATQSVTTTERCAEANINFEVDTSSIAGKSVVAYQSLYYEDMLMMEHKNINDEAQTVDIVSVSTNAVDRIEASATSTIKDVVSYCVRKGRTYTIKGTLMDKETGRALTINGQTVEKSITVTPTTNCGQAEITFSIDSTSISGKSLVSFEQIIYNNQIIARHEDLNDPAQTTDVVNITTNAVDNLDGDKFVKANNNSQIKDTVSYCVQPGQTYEIKGILMDKETGEALTINGQTIEASSGQFTPTTRCGEIELIFDLDSSAIAGKSIVTFEELFLDNTIIASHKDINDEDQTVDIVSVSTNAVDRIEASTTSTIKDVVSYCVRKGRAYTIKGTLMDKETGEALIINGQTVEASYGPFTPTANCGNVELTFNLNSSEIAGKSLVAFEEILFNNQIIAEHKDLNDPAQTTNIVSLDTDAVDNLDGDRYLEASLESAVKDTVSFCAQKGQTYTIKGILMDKATGEPLLIDGQTIEKTSEPFTPTEDCGEIELIFDIDSTSIAGKTIVAFEELFYGETVIASHKDIDDEDQTITVISIETYATDKETGKKIIPYDADVTINDHVKYCLKVGQEYTIRGTVMDKSTGNGLLVNNQLVEQEYTFTPTESCGEFDLLYTFNTTGLGGADLIIFDRLYIDDQLILDHNDINNALQSFAVELPIPDTGFNTKATGNGQISTGTIMILVAAAAITPISVYAINRHHTRKRFFDR